MNQQKGFSLIEVLVSLMLVASLAFSLLQQQMQCKQLLIQLLSREQRSELVDQMDEMRHAGIETLPTHELFP